MFCGGCVGKRLSRARVTIIICTFLRQEKKKIERQLHGKHGKRLVASRLRTLHAAMTA